MDTTPSTPAPRSRRSPWPHAITAVYIAFAAAMVAFVIFTTHSPTDLVTPDYYERELQHQDHLERERRGMAATDYAFTVDTGARQLALRFPAGPAVTGSILLYRPSDATLDRTVPIATDADRRQMVDLSGCVPGLWKVEVQWEQGGVGFYREHTLVTP
jgi:hypothetical protein